MPLVFDGADSAAGQGRVKAAQSAPAGLGLDHDTDQAKLHQIKNGGYCSQSTEGGNNVAITKNDDRNTYGNNEKKWPQKSMRGLNSHAGMYIR